MLLDDAGEERLVASLGLTNGVDDSRAFAGQHRVGETINGVRTEQLVSAGCAITGSDDGTYRAAREPPTDRLRGGAGVGLAAPEAACSVAAALHRLPPGRAIPGE